jgi:hypothetical protein
VDEVLCERMNDSSVDVASTNGNEVENPNTTDRLFLRSLTIGQVIRLDEILDTIGPFGEVRLIKAKGKLRFVQIVQSEDFLG